MIRSLAKMTSIGLIKPLSEAQKLVVERLGDQTRLSKARIHPMAVLLALKTYSAGRGFKGNLSWSPSQQICDALDSAFYMTFKNVTPCGKPIVLALDVSGSMDGSMIAGTHLSAREGSAAMALITAATEPNYEIIAFAAASGGYGGKWGGGESGIIPVKLSPRMRLDTVVRQMQQIPMGGTDCALPFIWASRNRIKASGFVTYTDSETWAGNIHPAQALKQYRKDFVADAKAIVVGMTANDFTIADPNDGGMMDVVGFDANAPSVMADFLRDAPASGVVEEEEPAVE